MHVVLHAGLLSQPASNDPATVVELRMECFPQDPASQATATYPNCERPLLFVRLSDHPLVVYRAFCDSNQELRFARLPLDIPLLPGPSSGMLMHRFDGLVNADTELPRGRAHRCKADLMFHPVKLDQSRVGGCLCVCVEREHPDSGRVWVLHICCALEEWRETYSMSCVVL